MNNYQQNNTSIQVVNVIFNNIVINSNINNLLSCLNVSFSELKRLVQLKMPSNDVKRKAIEVNSTLETLMNSTKEVDFDSRDEFSKKIIESCVCAIEIYREAEEDTEFGVELRQDLTSICNSFFDRELGNQLSSAFWYELKYYEWLHKERFIYNRLPIYGKKSERYFSDEQLEIFFGENRRDVIMRMLNAPQDNRGNLNVSSPLANKRKNTIFEAYKQLPPAT